MKRDLYKVLSIKSNASEKTIKKAFRKRVMETHPDRGGDIEEFKDVQLAYHVLSNPELRANYDKTGEIGDPTEPKNDYVEILETISQCLIQVTQQLIDRGQSLKTVDLVFAMKDSITGVQSGHKANLTKMKKSLEAYESVLGRFSAAEKDMDNYLDHAVQYQIKGLSAQVKNCSEVIGKFDKILGMLEKFKYRRDQSSSMSMVVDEFMGQWREKRESVPPGPLFLGTMNK